MISNVIAPANSNRTGKPSKSFSETILTAPLLPTVGFLSIAFMATFNLANVELNDQKVTLDAQLLLKLCVVLCAGLYGFRGFLLDTRVRKTLLNSTTICLTAVCAGYLLTSLVALDKRLAIVSSGCILCAVLAITNFCVQHGRQKAAMLMFYSIAVFLAGSWILYVAMPSIGVFNEPLADGEFLPRMGGLSHPNTLGQYCAAALILGACLLRTQAANRRFVIAIMLLAGLALYFAMSRTSTAAAIGGLVIVYRDRIFTRSWLRFGLAIVAIGTAALLFGSAFLNMEDKINDKVLGLLAKTSESSTDELTTATGRSVIWGKSIELIQDRPLTGWGAGSSKVLLIDYSQYTHNLFLNVWLSTGLIGGMFITLLICLMLYKVIAYPSMVADSLFAFVFLNGLFENVIFSNVASAPTLLFTLAIIWRYVPKIEGEKEIEYDSAIS
jgi:O-antigen ligase